MLAPKETTTFRILTGHLVTLYYCLTFLHVIYFAYYTPSSDSFSSGLSLLGTSGSNALSLDAADTVVVVIRIVVVVVVKQLCGRSAKINIRQKSILE